MTLSCPNCRSNRVVAGECIATGGGVVIECSTCGARLWQRGNELALLHLGNSQVRGSVGPDSEATISPHFSAPIDDEATLGPMQGNIRVEVGEILAGQYRVQGVLGQGGQGQVYMVRDELLEEQLALKVMVCGPGEDTLPAIISEYRALSRVRSQDHVVEVREPRRCRHAGEYLILLPMELMCMSLADWFRHLEQETPKERIRRVLPLLEQACRGLEDIHAVGLSHLDVKPRNLLLCAPSRSQTRSSSTVEWSVKIADFGLARARLHDEVRPELRLDGLGTPMYMAPEQILAAHWRDVGTSADIYALGMILYEMLDGDFPYSGTSEQIAKKKQNHSLRLRRPEGPRHLADLALECLQVDSTARPSTIEDVHRRLVPGVDSPVSIHSVSWGDGVPGRPSGSLPTAPAGISPGEIRILDLGGGVGMEFVWIPPGTFSMGSPDSEVGRFKDEGPVHEVSLTRGFWLGRFPVTQEQWVRVMGEGENPSSARATSGNSPVDSVSKEKASEFLARLAGSGCRLPTEAEWEYACRAGSRDPFYFGADEGRLAEYGWFGPTARGRPQEVGRLQPNSWGLHDMHGNLLEWCQDNYNADYYASFPRENPVCTDAQEMHVLRGGSWRHEAPACRSAIRFRAKAGSSRRDMGIRLARDDEPIEP